MQNLNPNIDPSKLGACILLYADSDAGKTTSFLTLEDPYLHINTQAKDARTTFAQFKHGKKITCVSPEGFDDLMNSLDRWVTQAKEDKFLPLSTIGKEVKFSAKYLNLLARSGKLVAYKEGRNWLTSVSSVKDYLENRKRQRN